MKLSSNSVHQFSQAPQATIPRSSFDRSHSYKTSFNAGFLVPFFLDEALPGDTFKVNVTAFARLATPIVPLMDNMFMDTHFFAVAHRLVWNNWEKFCGAQDNPGDSIDYTIPQTTTLAGGVQIMTLYDYFGVPRNYNSAAINNLAGRAYNLIWNEWFRHQDLQNSVTVDKGDGPDTIGNYVLLRRGKRHDYFTSSLPWPQKGDSVDIPLGTSAPITGMGALSTANYGATSVSVDETDGSAPVTYTKAVGSDTASPNIIYVEEDPNNAGFPNIRADLTNATAATINQLRQAYQVQRLLERDARGGTRYTEILKAHFGVTSPDARLQRPEYLGGGSSPINITEIPQTSSTDATTPQGNLAAKGTTVINGHGFTKSFTEHCMIIGLVSVRADLTYQQGLNRMWSRQTRYDYYWPALSHIGEQAVLNKEIYAQGASDPTADAGVWGYQARYDEYRYKPSMITGQLRSEAGTPLDHWHLSQEFGSPPALDSTFIEENPPIDRVVAVPSEPDFIFDSFISMRCARPMPLYGVPGFIDHF